MSWFDFAWHLANLAVQAFGVAALVAAFAKLLWRDRLAGHPWHVLALWSFSAGVGVTILGLVIFGQDGRIATYVALCAVCAATVWWLGFMRR
mgnify:CR=1 FL=1